MVVAASPDSCTAAVMEEDTAKQQQQQQQQCDSSEQPQQPILLPPADRNKEASPMVSTPKSKAPLQGRESANSSRTTMHDSSSISNNGSSAAAAAADGGVVNESILNSPDAINQATLPGKNANHKRPATDAPDDDDQETPSVISDEKPAAVAVASSTRTAAVAASPSTLLSTRPVKRPKTAYFLFCDEKRAQVQQQHPGEAVTVIAKALGRLWATLSDEDKQVYQQMAADDRERVAHDLEAWMAAGGEAVLEKEAQRQRQDHVNNGNNNTNGNSTSLALPAARIRKICKLDPEVKGLSKEALLLVTKAAELFTAKLGMETVRVAQIQNRRKLLPEDVAQVCQSREPFYFLREDILDLAREQKQQTAAAAAGAKSDATGGAASSGSNAKHNHANNTKAAIGTKPLTAYFSAKTK